MNKYMLKLMKLTKLIGFEGHIKELLSILKDFDMRYELSDYNNDNILDLEVLKISTYKNEEYYRLYYVKDKKIKI